MVDLQLKTSLDMIGKIHIKNGCNHAKISLVKNDGEDIRWMILHVRKEKTNMEDIETINPEVEIDHQNKIPTSS
jgi:hypothetical protein